MNRFAKLIAAALASLALLSAVHATTYTSNTEGTTLNGVLDALSDIANGTGASKACTDSVVYDASTSGSTQLVALSSGKTIYLCGYTIVASGAVNVKLITGTGSACATGSANITPAYQLTSQTGVVDGSPFFRGLKGAASSAVCINTSGAVAVQAIIYYTQP